MFKAKNLKNGLSKISAKKGLAIGVTALSVLGIAGAKNQNKVSANSTNINSNHTLKSNNIQPAQSKLVKDNTTSRVSQLEQKPEVQSGVKQQANQLHRNILSHALSKTNTYNIGSKTTRMDAVHSHRVHHRRIHMRRNHRKYTRRNKMSRRRYRRHYQLKHRKHYKKNGVKRYSRIRKHHIKLSHRKYRNRYAKKHLRAKNVKRHRHLKKRIKRQNKARNQISHKYNVPNQKSNNVNNQKQNTVNNANNQQNNSDNNTNNTNNTGNIQKQANQMHSQIVNNNAGNYIKGEPLVSNQQVTAAYTSPLGVHVPAGYKAINYNGRYFGDSRGDMYSSDKITSDYEFPQSNIVPVGAGYIDLTQSHNYPYPMYHRSDSDIHTPSPSTYDELEPQFPLLNGRYKSRQQLLFEHNPMVDWTPQQFNAEYIHLKSWAQQILNSNDDLGAEFTKWDAVASSFADADHYNINQAKDIDGDAGDYDIEYVN